MNKLKVLLITIVEALEKTSAHCISIRPLIKWKCGLFRETAVIIRKMLLNHSLLKMGKRNMGRSKQRVDLHYKQRFRNSSILSGVRFTENGIYALNR